MDNLGTKYQEQQLFSESLKDYKIFMKNKKLKKRVRELDTSSLEVKFQIKDKQPAKLPPGIEIKICCWSA